MQACVCIRHLLQYTCHVSRRFDAPASSLACRIASLHCAARLLHCATRAELIRHLPLAKDVVLSARQELVMRLDGYSETSNELFTEVCLLMRATHRIALQY